MSIKTSIFLFLLMMGFSFSSHAAYYRVTSSLMVCDEMVASVGDVVNTSNFFESLPKTLSCNNDSSVKNYFFTNKGSHYMFSARSTSGSFYYGLVSGYAVTASSCPSDSSYNPSTGICETTPVCEPPSILNPDTFECFTPPFCERDSTNESLFDAEQSCAAEGGIFSHQCSDFLESLETRCTQSDKCAIGFPGWPDCMQDLDPTDDITPPSGGFNPGSGPTANPDGPSFDKPEPDDVTPTDTTDEAVLEAIQNANRDSNEGFKALSTDLNNGFTDINNSLSNLNATNTAIGESVVDQMNQDYEIYQANKDLALQQTGAITAGASSITDALGAQTGALTGALGEQTGALTDALGELAAKLPEQCDPTEDNNYCQSPHGLGAEFIGDTFYQMDNQVDGIISDGESLIQSTLQSIIDSPLNDENESIMNNATSVLLNALGFNESCSPLTFEANGENYSISCEVSEKIKLVLSFLIGIYTLMTLTDVLLDGITPIGRKPSATRYA
ncbi:hypothetical protein BCV29_16925 [Vibrio cyclitrophicus]|uniref:hypothetical protein n=1 Tax=Vibrio cyclitrophicus TaxID=47951 RepID=UPI000C84C609|nr:hypothetical protein [Vibrio cyclitrophicus]PME75657.1 hypothetical protein BCV29_16725 [Vibrio cyclitrophicus]